VRGEEQSPDVPISLRVAADSVKSAEDPSEITNAGSPAPSLTIDVPVCPRQESISDRVGHKGHNR
jgi:hypothetical protein